MRNLRGSEFSTGALSAFPAVVLGLWFGLAWIRLTKPSAPLRAGTLPAWVRGVFSKRIREQNRAHIRNLCGYYGCLHPHLCERIVVRIPSRPAELRRTAAYLWQDS